MSYKPMDVVDDLHEGLIINDLDTFIPMDIDLDIYHNPNVSDEEMMDNLSKQLSTLKISHDVFINIIIIGHGGIPSRDSIPILLDPTQIGDEFNINLELIGTNISDICQYGSILTYSELIKKGSSLDSDTLIYNLNMQNSNHFRKNLSLRTKIIDKNTQKEANMQSSYEDDIIYTKLHLNNKIANKKYSEKIFTGYSQKELEKRDFMGHVIPDVKPNHPYAYVNIYINNESKYKSMIELDNYIVTSQIINSVINKIKNNLNILSKNDTINIRFVDTLCSVGSDLNTGKYVTPVGTPYNTGNKNKTKGGKKNKNNKTKDGKKNKNNKTRKTKTKTKTKTK